MIDSMPARWTMEGYSNGPAENKRRSPLRGYLMPKKPGKKEENMKLEDMIMVVENRKGKEANFLLNLTGYMELALKLWGEYAEDMAEAVSSLYGTKGEKKEWGDLYFAEDKSIRVSFSGSFRHFWLEILIVGNGILTWGGARRNAWMSCGFITLSRTGGPCSPTCIMNRWSIRSMPGRCCTT